MAVTSINEPNTTVAAGTTPRTINESGDVSPGSYGREALTANRTYYVRTDGNDLQNGLANTSMSAFKTIQKAINVVANTLDIGPFDVTIRVADGTYTAGIYVSAPWTGSGNVILRGNETTPSNCVISAPDNCIYVSDEGWIAQGARLVVGGFKLISPSPVVTAGQNGLITFDGPPMEFGASSGAHLLADYHGIINVSAPLIISGACSRHAFAHTSGLINYSPPTVTITGAPALGDFATAQRLGVIRSSGVTFSGAPAASTRKYNVLSGGCIDVGGAGVGYFPGTVAGVVDASGIYV